MDEKMKQRREEIIQDMMEKSGMSRQDAAFAADVELGILPKGDVIEVDNDEE